METHELELAVEKTEAVLLTGLKRLKPVSFQLRGVNIVPKPSVKYLEVAMDCRMTFTMHAEYCLQKAAQTTKAMASIMPRVEGPRTSKHLLLASVVMSTVLYGAPAWAEVLTLTKWKKKFIALQRSLNLRITTAYRTVSADALAVLAGTIPIELCIKERRSISDMRSDTDRMDQKSRTIEEWQERWDGSQNGRRTHKIIPKWRNGYKENMEN